MSNPFNCSKCGQRIVGNPFKLKTKNYCGNCYELVIQSVQKFEEEKEKLYSYIKKIFSCDDIPIEALNGIDRLLNNDYKPKGIQLTIEYYYVIEQHQISQESLCYVQKTVESYYQKAKDYYAEVKKIREHNEGVDINVPAKTVRVKKVTKKEERFPYRMEDL